ncbi:hypothetical protein F1559_000650 [Cyanidiococcus yangmingshanensis]|uniref:J domain-containing protein n=1 Tax=Cyanidiococcus yangmingshanensis TaxID=2690220 RepID=A0A7J7ICU6_9RHOD|nr:hypothetical protein F1559_000650 [Cyanidiococcus yangmingshanensis]
MAARSADAQSDYHAHYCHQVREWELKPARPGYCNGRFLSPTSLRVPVRASRRVAPRVPNAEQWAFFRRAPYFGGSNLWGGDGGAQQRNLYWAWREILKSSELWRDANPSDELQSEFVSWWLRFEQAYAGDPKRWNTSRKNRERERFSEDVLDTQEQDLYAVLGVDEQASLETIRTAYRQEVKRCHPDALGTGVKGCTDPALLARFLEVQGAWQILSDPELRRQYDLGRRVDRKAHPSRS